MEVKQLEKSCEKCKEIFISTHPRHKYCSKNCRKTSYKYFYEVEPWRKQVSSGTVGCISELAVIQDLLIKGFYVFRNIGPNSPCDLVAIKENKIIRIEVKTGYLGGGKLYPNSIDQKQGKDYDVLAIAISNKVTYVPDISIIEKIN